MAVPTLFEQLPHYMQPKASSRKAPTKRQAPELVIKTKKMNLDGKYY